MSTRFDLEKAVAAWRRTLESNSTFRRDDLDELEDNLRERYATLVDAGARPEEAFPEALRRIGHYDELEREYRKVQWVRSKRRERLRSEIRRRAGLLRSYLTVALRRLARERAYAGLNVIGLAIGLGACIVIGAYVEHELSYDRFHSDADRIFRVALNMENSTPSEWPSVFLPLGPALENNFPEIEHSVRVQTEPSALVETPLLRRRESRFLYVEPLFFEIFDFRVLRGNPEAGLSRPFTVAITRETARRYFGARDPLGQKLKLNNEHELEVVAIIEPAPTHSHVTFDFLASFATTTATGAKADEWRRLAFTYVKLGADRDADVLEPRLSQFTQRLVGSRFPGMAAVRLIPLTEIHLRGMRDIQPQGDIRYLYLFSAVGAIILLMAGINYVNIATARSARRAKEVGIRKVVGAERRQLVFQFMGESAAHVAVALPAAILLAVLLLPQFAALVERPLAFQLSPRFLSIPLAAAALVAFVGGIYPALVLSSFRASAVLKGKEITGGGASLRKLLVVLQFGASVGLIACTTVIYEQLGYIQSAHLGFEPEQVLVIETYDELKENAAAFKEELLHRPEVERVSLAYSLPGRDFAHSFFPASSIEGYIPPEGESAVVVSSNWVDWDFVDALGIDLVDGRNFSPNFPSDEQQAVIINETAQRRFGWENPLGKTLDGRKVVGVVEDFHLGSFRNEIEPTVLFPSSGASTRAIVKLRSEDIRSSLSNLKEIWSSFVPSIPFEYTFLDEDFEAMYRAEERLGRLFFGFAALAILIASLGLLGLVAYMAESRTKEIGIRKVLGATSANIVALLTKQFAGLLIVAVLIAIPVSYLFMSRWLEGFAYHVTLGPKTFMIAGLLTIAIAGVTISRQALRAAAADPVRSLRYE